MAPSDDETRQLLILLPGRRSNQRRIYVALAITVACTTAVMLSNTRAAMNPARCPSSAG